MKFYTWKDVERYFLLHRASWESAIAAVDVYPTDITVYAKPDACDQVEEILRAMFRSNYDVSEHKIKLDIGDRELPVEIQEDDGGSKCPVSLVILSGADAGKSVSSSHCLSLL